MSVKSQNNNILLAAAGFALVVVVVALIGYFALGKDEPTVQGQVEVTEYRVSSKVPGRIVELRVKEGDYVRVGDTLAILDAPEVNAKMQQAQSAEDAASAMDLMARKGARAEQIKAAYQLLQQVKAELEKMPKAQFYSLVDLEHQPAMDADMQRIIKLCMLEKKLIGQDVPDALVMMLAMLHDRSNPAKGLLESHNVTYDALTYILKGKRETAGSYGFADDDNQQPPASDDDTPTSGAKSA